MNHARWPMAHILFSVFCVDELMPATVQKFGKQRYSTQLLSLTDSLIA